jgi:hypothetical protein
LPICTIAGAAEADGVRITRALRDVKVVSPQGRATAATLNQPLLDGSVLRTGPESRAEIVLGRSAIARIGGKSALKSDAQGRAIELQEGAVLFQAAKGGSSPKITTGNIHVATAGSTGLIERYGTAYAKILVLEGTARVYLQKIGESVLVNAGQMLITKPAAASLPEPVHFEIAKLYQTSQLTNRDFAPLASNARIEAAIREQQSDPSFTPTNLVIYGRGTLVNLVAPTPTPAPPMKAAGASKQADPPASRSNRE